MPWHEVGTAIEPCVWLEVCVIIPDNDQLVVASKYGSRVQNDSWSHQDARSLPTIPMTILATFSWEDRQDCTMFTMLQRTFFNSIKLRLA